MRSSALRRALGAILVLLCCDAARADEPNLLARSRLGAWQLHMNVLLGVEPVDNDTVIAFGTSAELLWHCRIGVFAGLLSSKGNAERAAVSGSVVSPAPADRISVPFGMVFRPFGHFGVHAGDGVHGWGQRLAAGFGVQLGISVEHIRITSEGDTVPAFHGAAIADIPLWGGPVEGGIAIRLEGRLIATHRVTLDSGGVVMPGVGGQFYGGLAWQL